MPHFSSAISESPKPVDGGVTLDQFQVGELGKIMAIQADVDLKQRLAALGLRVGCEVHVLRKASLGGPVHVRVGTTEVIMRRIEAKRILTLPMQKLLKEALAGSLSA